MAMGMPGHGQQVRSVTLKLKLPSLIATDAHLLLGGCPWPRASVAIART